MMIGTFSAPDPQRQGLNSNGQVANITTTGLTAVDPHLADPSKTLILFVAGQSNSANWQGPSLYTFTQSNIHMFDVANRGGVYLAAEPLLGADGTQSSFVSRLADDIRANNSNIIDRIIIVSVGAGGTNISQWDYLGDFHSHIKNAVSRMKSMGWLNGTKQVMIWNQGEADAQLSTTSVTYKQILNNIYSSAQSLGWTGPCFVTKATWSSGGLQSNSTVIRSAQTTIVDNIKFYAGPDQDALNDTYRHDTTHLNTTGAASLASSYRTLIVNYLLA